MYWDITSAEYEMDYQIRVRFRDGKSGVVDLKPLVDKGGVFTALRDIEAFKAFSIDTEWHVLSWEDGRIDVAPETVYEEATGERVLSRVAEEHEAYGSSP
jgi:hypothetical protein